MTADRRSRSGSLRVGQYVGRYRIGWLVGIGATSEIYVAGDDRLKRDVVLKLIVLPTAAREQLHRLQREVAALAAVPHPNVLRVYECGLFEGQPYLVTDFAAGGSLEELLRAGPPPISTAFVLLRAVADGLDHLHAAGIVHGDVKPANVLLARDGLPLVADFGLARLPAATAPGQAGGRPQGTPLYMPPEQIRGGAPEAASDVYSFAVLAFQLLSGRLPFTAEVSADVMHKHLTAVPPPITLLAPALPNRLDAVLSRGMAKDPAQRWPSCGDLVDAMVADPAAGERPAGVASRLVSRFMGGLSTAAS